MDTFTNYTKDLVRLDRKGDWLKHGLYWYCWAFVFFLVSMLTTVWPEATLFLMKVVSPITNLVKGLFWLFMPDDARTVRKIGEVFGSVGNWTMSRLSPTKQVAIRAGFFDGLVLVSVLAIPLKVWLKYWYVTPWLAQKHLELFNKYRELLK